MNRRIRNVAITLAAVLMLSGAAVWLAPRLMPAFRTNCPAVAPGGISEIGSVLGQDVSGADRAVIQSGLTGKSTEIKGKAKVAEFTARFAGTDPRVQSVTGPMAGYTLMATFYRSGQKLGSFAFGDNAIVFYTADATTVYSTAKKLDTDGIVKAYHLGNS